MAAVYNSQRTKRGSFLNPEDISPDLKMPRQKPSQEEMKRKQMAITARMGGRV